MDQLPIFREPPLKPPNAPFDAGPKAGKLPATKHGSEFQIALADLEPLLDARLTDLERQVFTLQAQHISELKARIIDLERSRRRRRKPTENPQFHHDQIATLHKMLTGQ